MHRVDFGAAGVRDFLRHRIERLRFVEGASGGRRRAVNGHLGAEARQMICNDAPDAPRRTRDPRDLPGQTLCAHLPPPTLQ